MTTLQLPEVIHTPRLLLRPYRFEDVDDVLAYACDEEWSRYLIGVPNPYRRADALQFLARQTLLDRAVHPAWAVVFEDAVVGGVNIRFKFDYAIADMGWSINRLLWGRGMATEAAQAVVDAAFTTHPQLKRIAATADERNVPFKQSQARKQQISFPDLGLTDYEYFDKPGIRSWVEIVKAI